eukprot:m51a1_g11661 hypothetical protein (548) ;mRNA; r:458-8788
MSEGPRAAPVDIRNDSGAIMTAGSKHDKIMDPETGDFKRYEVLEDLSVVPQVHREKIEAKMRELEGRYRLGKAKRDPESGCVNVRIEMVGHNQTCPFGSVYDHQGMHFTVLTPENKYINVDDVATPEWLENGGVSFNKGPTGSGKTGTTRRIVDEKFRPEDRAMPKIDLLILDEFRMLLSNLTSKTMSNQRSFGRGELLQMLEDLVRNAKCVLVLDADLDDCAVQFLVKLRHKENDVVIANEYIRRDGNGRQLLRHANLERLLCAAVKALQEGKRIAIPCALQKVAETVRDYIKERCPDKKIVYLDRDTPDETKKQYADVTRMWGPENCDCLIYTSTIGVGIDYSVPIEETFDSLFVIHQLGGPTTHDLFQMMGRIRCLRNPIRERFVRLCSQDTQGLDLAYHNETYRALLCETFAERARDINDLDGEFFRQGARGDVASERLERRASAERSGVMGRSSSGSCFSSGVSSSRRLLEAVLVLASDDNAPIDSVVVVELPRDESLRLVFDFETGLFREAVGCYNDINGVVWFHRRPDSVSTAAEDRLLR